MIKQIYLFIVDCIGLPLKYKKSCNRNTDIIGTCLFPVSIKNKF